SAYLLRVAPSCLLSLLTRSTPPLLSTRSLHDALPISRSSWTGRRTTARRPPSAPTPSADACGPPSPPRARGRRSRTPRSHTSRRSEEHTSELQSRFDLVCRLLLENNNSIAVAAYSRAH